MAATKILFDVLKQILKDAVSAPEFIAGNSILRDGVTKEELLARIDALNRGYTFERGSGDSYAITGNTTINDTERTIDTSAGDPAPAVNSCVFDIYSPGAPFRLTGWSFTVLDSGGGVDLANIEVYYRDVIDPASVDPWHRLNQEDCTEVLNQVQVKIVVATLTSLLAVRRIVLLAEQV